MLLIADWQIKRPSRYFCGPPAGDGVVGIGSVELRNVTVSFGIMDFGIGMENVASLRKSNSNVGNSNDNSLKTNPFLLASDDTSAAKSNILLIKEMTRR